MSELDPLTQAYKDQFPGISDEGAQLQALLNRFNRSAGPEWSRVPIGDNAIFLTIEKD